MATSRADIRRWLEEGKERGATHVLVVCDTYDYDDYPKYVMPGQDVREMASAKALGEMQRLMEVYNLALDFDVQLAERRSYNY